MEERRLIGSEEGKEERRENGDSGWRSSAAITGCQLAKKSNARFPRYAMLC